MRRCVFLGRRHDATERSQRTRKIGWKDFRPVFSFDLIYARPDQSADKWRRELNDALVLAGDHLSAYQLTIEPGTPFARAYDQGRLSIPDEPDAESLFDITQSILDDAGLPAYEISNHARRGHECRHNLTYWRYAPYVGIGPGAHGRLPAARGSGRVATAAIRAPEAWAKAVSTAGHGTRVRQPVAPDEAAEEAILMGLRLVEGIAAASFYENSGRSLEKAISRRRRAELVTSGDLIDSDTVLRTTDKGRKRLNAVIEYLLATDLAA